jgi:CBS domain-containing protein
MTRTQDPLQEPVSRLRPLDFAKARETMPYREALKALAREPSRALLVCKGEALTGILTGRDILDRCALGEVAPKTPVGDFMTRQPAAIGPEATLASAISLMHKKKIRHLPVVDSKGRPVGLVTAGRAIRHLAAHFPLEVLNLPPMPDPISEEPEGA